MLYYDNILGLFGNPACSKRLKLDDLCAPFQPKLFLWLYVFFYDFVNEMIFTKLSHH